MKKLSESTQRSLDVYNNPSIAVCTQDINSLKNPNQFIVGEFGLLRRRNSVVESGHLYFYTIRKFTKIRNSEFGKYDYKGLLEIVVDGEKKVIEVKMSKLLSYRILQNKHKYLDVTYVSYNTTPHYVSNPLMLVKTKTGVYVLFSVTEKGNEYYKIEMPTGDEKDGVKYLTHKPEDYLRYRTAKAFNEKTINDASK